MNMLVTGDIHIGDYSSYNYEHHSRLNQFNKLALRLVELGTQYHCKIISILGDLIDKPNSRPYVMHEVNKFIKILCDNFEEVWYILGNHDIDSKSQELTASDSLVTILDYPNLKYMDKQVIEINDHKYGFMNWRPDQDLTWLGDQHLNVLFGHYTKSEMFGQDIDESKFDLMIHSDIHNSQVIGKFVSTCNPIQKDMSSEAEGKVIIFDLETAKWQRVLTDPDHTRFLQIAYTSDKAQEGFHGPLQYYIYKPIIEVTSEEKKLDLTWNDIDELINDTCKSNNLEDLHGEVVAKCTELNEVDFDFQLVSVDIHGYRSIEDLHLDFTKGDRIALLGENGSGKSSIIRAIQSIFGKNSELKYEKSDFTDDVQVTLKLVYQNKLYEIRKGNSWGLFIDSQEQPYSGIRDFESDLVNKLPFIAYLDLFFLNANVSNLSNKLSPTQRIDLISRFYRLDRIDAYYKTAMSLYNDTNKELIELQSQRNVQCGIQDHISSRLSELSEYKDKDQKELEDKLQKLRDLKDKFQQHQLWSKEKQTLEVTKDQVSKNLSSCQSSLSNDPDQLKIDIEDLQKKCEEINSAYEKLFTESVQFEDNLRKLLDTESSGIKIKEKLEKLKSGTCPECGAPLAGSKNKDLVEKYTTELNNLYSEWDKYNALIISAPKGRDSKEYYFKALTELKKYHKETKDSVDILQTKFKQIEINKTKYNSIKEQLDSVNSKLNDLKDHEPEKVILPIETDQLESKYVTDIVKKSEYDKQVEELRNQTKIIESYDKKISDKTVQLDRYNHYLELTAMTGIIYEEILKKLAVKFSTTEVKYEVESGIYRGSRFINFNSYFLSKGTYRLYESCSDGQKTVCDLDFLEKLFSINVGMLVLDEYLKHLDEINFSKICDTLQRMNVNTLILSTHDANLTAYTKRILLQLDSTGRTQATIV